MAIKIEQKPKIFIANKKQIIPKEIFYLGTGTYDKEKNEYFVYQEYAYCPICHKMESIYKFYEKKGDKTFVQKKLIEDPFYFYKLKNDKGTDKLFRWVNRHDYYHYTGHIVRCPNCGQNLANYEIVFLQRAGNYYLTNSFFENYNIRKSGDKLIMDISIKTFFPNTDVGKLAISFSHAYYIFNKKTGQSFAAGPFKNGKYIGAGRNFYNITYSTYYLTDNPIFNKIIENKQIREALKELIIKKEDFDIIKDEDSIRDFIRKIVLYNRFSYYPKQFINSVNSWLSTYNGSKYIRQYLYKYKNTEQLDLNELISKFNAPSKKKFKKLAAENPILLQEYKIVKKLGFKNYDIIINILQQNDFFFQNFVYDSIDNISVFIKDMIKEKGEPEVYKKLFNLSVKPVDITQFYIEDLKDECQTIADAANMYLILKSEKINIDKIFEGDIYDIHDNLSVKYKYVNIENIEIKYSEKEKEFIDEVDGFSFELPKNTHELIKIGDELHICVGSYGERALHKDCTIVVMRKDGIYVGCLEIRKKNLLQAKAVCNNLLQEYKAEALKKWVELHELNTSICNDYTHIATGKIEYDKDKIYQNKTRYENWGI